MKISLNWLRELVDLPAELDVETIARHLTLIGFEIEGIEARGKDLSGVVVAEVLGIKPHPKADKLRIVRVRAGTREEDVVCGAPNVPAPGGRVAWAAPGATLPGGLRLEAREVRGVMSPGMLCAEDELGLGEGAEGILILDADTPSGEDLVSRFGLLDHILEVNVTPNRPDALSHLGLARELGAHLGRPLVAPPAPKTTVASSGPTMDVNVLEGSGCVRYQARFVTGVKVGPSPLSMRLRLSACGVRPISNLVDVTNYVLLETGHPLHAFDLDKLAKGIVVRRAQQGERIKTLDGVDRTLESHDIVIGDGRGPVALAGVMGGATSEIGPDTKHVLLEAATFDPPSVRRTSKRLGLSSESSYRFERGVDANGIPHAAERATALLASLGGGAVVSQQVDRYPSPVTARKVTLSLARLRRVSGTAYDAQEARGALTKVAAPVEVTGSGDDTIFSATVPTYRPDLRLEEDLIEEVLRLSQAYVTPARPELVLTNADVRPNPEAPADQARRLLAAAGLSEIVSWGFVPRAALAPLGGSLADGIAVKNPISADYELMRTSLLPGLTDALRRNVSRGTADLALFEVGPVVRRGPEGAPPFEPTYAAGMLTGRNAGWLKPGDQVDFFDAKRVVEDLLRIFGLVDAAFEPANDVTFLHPGVSAQVRSASGAVVGAVGELHPALARKLGLEARTFYFEICIDALETARPALRTQAPPRFPAATRDLSFWIDVNVSSADQRRAFAAAAEPLLRDLAALEDFRDPKYVPEGKKGMLWSMTYRSDDRTLTDAEVDASHAKVIQTLKNRYPIGVR